MTFADTVWLGDRTPGRDNNVKLIRHAAALAVILFHSMALSGHIGEEPLWRHFPETDLGLFGVQVFFVLSGFLVTQSWLARPQLAPFAAARILRIYPALVVSTLLTIALAGWSSTLPWHAFADDPQTHAYLWRTASGYDVTDGLPGAFARNPWPNAVNGSLWTLPVELRLYGAVLVAGLLGLIGRRWAWIVALAALGIAAALLLARMRLTDHERVLRDLVLLFAIASAACVLRARIPLSLAAATVCIALFVANPGGHLRGTWALPLLAYVVLVIAYHPRLRVRIAPFERAGDYSYGLYVYAFPIQQTIAMGAPGIAPWTLFAATIVVAGAAAALSWHALEAPALRLKDRLRDRPAARPHEAAG
jgi:peptidoglycan/LPS O-acetylase OafA/YrhL